MTTATTASRPTAHDEPWTRPLLGVLLFASAVTLADAPLKFLPKLFALERISLGALGAAVSAGGAGEIAIILCAAALTRRAPRGAMALGACLEGLGLMGFELRGLGLAGLIAASALTRAGSILAVTGSSTLLAQLTPAERRTRAIAGYWAVIQISRNALGPPATEGLMDALGFRHAAAIFGVVALSGVALAAASRPAPAQPAGPGADAGDPRGGRGLAALAHFSVAYLLLSVVFVAQDAFLTSYAAARGIAVASPFFIAYAGVMIVARLLFGHLPDRYGRAKVMHASLLALVAFFSALLVVRSAPLFWATGALAAAGNALLWPSLFALSYERVRVKAYATAWTMLLTAASSVLGGLALGAVAERGGHGALYAVAIALCLAAWALLFAPRRTAPAAASPP